MAFWRWGRSTENEVKVADAGATDSLAKPSSSAVPQLAGGAYATVPPGASPPPANPAGGALTASTSSNPYTGITADYGQQASFTTPVGSNAYTRPDSTYPYPVTSANPGQVHTAGVTTRTELYPHPSTGQYPHTNPSYGAVQPQMGPYPSTLPGTGASGGAHEALTAESGAYGYGAAMASSRRTATAWGQDTASSIPGYPTAEGYPTQDANQAGQGYPPYGTTEGSASNGHYAPTEQSGWGDSTQQGATQAPPPRPWSQESQVPQAGWSGPSVDTSAAYGGNPTPYAATMPNIPNYAGGGTPGVTPNPPGRGSAESQSAGTYPSGAEGQTSPRPTEIPTSRTNEPYRPGSTSTYNPAIPASFAVGSASGRWGSPAPGPGYPTSDGSGLVQANYNQPSAVPASAGATSGYPSTGYPTPAWGTAASQPY